MYDYYYGQQADQFAFYRVPKLLFTERRFRNLSTDAKMLYGLFLDRMSLSAKSGWMDPDGRVYIVFTVEEIQEALDCGVKKAIKMLDELESMCGLIERKRQGLGKPNLIYVKNFVDSFQNGQFQNRQKDSSGTCQNAAAERLKRQGSNTDMSNTELSKTDPFLSSENDRWESEGMGKDETYEKRFERELSMNILREEYPYDRELLDGIFSLIVETMHSRRKLIRIASDDMPAELVKKRFLELNSEHIKYVISCFKENTTKIRNVRQYLLASIFNAPPTMDGYYQASSHYDQVHNS